MSSLFSQHLNFFSLSTSFLYCNMGRGVMSSFFLFFFVVWFLQAAFGCVWGRGRGSAERIERATTTALNPDLIHIYFKQHFLPSFFQYILALLALWHTFFHFFTALPWMQVIFPYLFWLFDYRKKDFFIFSLYILLFSQ